MGETNTPNLETTWTKILTALDKLETLRIETTVSPLAFVVKDGATVLEPTAGPAEGIVTEVQFLRGDITMRMSPGMVAGTNATLMEAHTRHVAESREIIRTNIKAIVDLVDQVLKR
jgi:hypothetical protein